jgi:hypothetical protein
MLLEALGGSEGLEPACNIHKLKNIYKYHCQNTPQSTPFRTPLGKLVRTLVVP